ncbi:Immunity protein SdpI [Calothrix sp. NIES-4101]|nr:Immunity protein SdpI [Calothrix sp. NIES-4101]
MLLRKAEITSFVIVLTTLIVGVKLYPQLPEQMAAHWNILGQVDGYIPKKNAVFLPLILIAIATFILTIIPRFEKRFRANIQSFRNYYDGFIIIFDLFLVLIYLQTLIWNLGITISFSFTMPIFLGILWLYLGFLLEKTKINRFCGIRTPWTMQSETVWHKTHLIAGKLFKLAGLISGIGIIFPRLSFFFALVPIFGILAYIIIYSYQEYQQEKQHSV